MTRPNWIRARFLSGNNSERVSRVLDGLGLHTVCLEADCPNRGECWESGNATFIVLGDICTRNCRFCNVKKGIPLDPDPEEPRKVAEAVKELGIKYAVITSVTRDDLSDLGAGHFLETVISLKNTCPDVPIELLIPDFAAKENLLEKISFSGSEVIGHNIEMPESLYPSLRPGADYKRSLEALKVLSFFRDSGADILVKSSLMLGMGESKDDILSALRDLKNVGIDIVYMGQYLSPSQGHWPIEKYYTPDEFLALEDVSRNMGFRAVVSSPMVRSSYRAGETYHKIAESKTTK
jgi:lipoyl synthase